MTKMKTIVAGLVIFIGGFLLFSGAASACTIGVASGEVTQDGRPQVWKVRQWSDPVGNHVVYKVGAVYDFIGIKGAGGNETEIRMGVNTAGLATGNALNVEQQSSGNSAFIEYALGHFATVPQVAAYLQAQLAAGTFTAASAFPFIDALGNAVMFETDPSQPGHPGTLYTYDTLDWDRYAQDLYGWVVRDNYFHWRSNGTDNINMGGRYESAKFNTWNLVELGVLSPLTVTQGNNGNQQFEFLRYGPDGYQDYATIPESDACSAMTVHGVHTNENSVLTTMWSLMGHPNFGIAVPLWPVPNAIPTRLQGPDMAILANGLHGIYPSVETDVQTAVFPSEHHLFDEVEELMGHWRTDYVEGKERMARVSETMTDDAYSLMDCLVNCEHFPNLAPNVNIQFVERKNPLPTPDLTKASRDTRHTFRFTATANDPDGTVNAYAWDFGDGQTAGGSVVTHTYGRTGYFLVSCTVTDNDNVTTTDWQYLLSGVRCGGIQGLGCAKGEYCKFADDTCHWADLFGVCTLMPSECQPGGPAVCGCNDVTYENECFAEMAGVSIQHDGACLLDGMKPEKEID